MNVEVHTGSNTHLDAFMKVLSALKDSKRVRFTGGHATFEEISD